MLVVRSRLLRMIGLLVPPFTQATVTIGDRSIVPALLNSLLQPLHQL